MTEIAYEQEWTVTPKTLLLCAIFVFYLLVVECKQGHKAKNFLKRMTFSLI